MENLLVAVLIHERPEPFQALHGRLADLSVKAYCAKKCTEAERLIAQYQPLMVFVDLPIWSESHGDLVNMAKGTDQTFNIVVVGPLPDTEEYVSAIKQGAFNFVAPPLSYEALIGVVHSAAIDARERRESPAQTLSAHAAG
jgi:DNA-binding NtrC family response regulator